MDTNKIGVLECFDKYEVTYDDEDMAECSDDSVLTCLDNNYKYDFNVYLIHVHPLE